MAVLLKNVVSDEEIKAAGLTGKETVESLNLWAKGQKSHKSNYSRQIFDENGATGYVVVDNKTIEFEC